MYYILKGHKPVPASAMEWAQWFEKADRQVCKTDLGPKGKVSTIFGGMDMCIGRGKPLLFETLIFGGLHTREGQKYSTWDEAVVGHEAAVKLCKGDKDETAKQG